jgi:hypothetical protein
MKDVSYVHANEVKGVLLYEECFFRKRPHFSHEKEVRISLDTYNRHSPRKDTPIGIAASINLGTFVEKILVHPDSPAWFVAAVNSLTTKYEIHAKVEKGRYGNR